MLRRGHVIASTQRCPGAVVVRCYPVPEDKIRAHYGSDDPHHNAASSGSADISWLRPRGSRLYSRVFLQSPDNNDIGHTSDSVELQSRQRHQLVVAIATDITGEADLADLTYMITMCMGACAYVYVYVQNRLRDASAVRSWIRSARRASRVHSV